MEKHELQRLEKSNITIDKKAMKLNPNSAEYKQLLEELAAAGNFDVHTTKINPKNVKEIDGKYKYKPKNILYKFTRTIAKSIIYLIGPIINKIGFNLKIKGRKNLKGVKSAITISNHVHYLDCLMNFQAVKKRNFYIVAANHNMKKGLAGYLFKASGVLPLSNSLEASKNLNRTIKDILSKNGYVHMYAESALWFRYERSRPLKIGAFKIAAENNVPVVPMVILFRPKGKHEIFRRKKCITLIIGKPIYPENDLLVRENAQNMKDICQKYYNDTVCDFYGYDKETYSIYKTPNKKIDNNTNK